LLTAETLRLSRNTTVIIVTSAIDPEWIAATRHLLDRGVRATAILIDPGSFGMPYNALEAEIELTASYIPHYMVRQGDPLEQALANSRSTRY
jgi:hypothetical protein